MWSRPRLDLRGPCMTCAVWSDGLFEAVNTRHGHVCQRSLGDSRIFSHRTWGATRGGNLAVREHVSIVWQRRQKVRGEACKTRPNASGWAHRGCHIVDQCTHKCTQCEEAGRLCGTASGARFRGCNMCHPYGSHYSTCSFTGKPPTPRIGSKCPCT